MNTGIKVANIQERIDRYLAAISALLWNRNGVLWCVHQRRLPAVLPHRAALDGGANNVDASATASKTEFSRNISTQVQPGKLFLYIKKVNRGLFGIHLCTLFNTASSTVPQIPRSLRVLGSNPGLLRLWQMAIRKYITFLLHSAIAKKCKTFCLRSYTCT